MSSINIQVVLNPMDSTQMAALALFANTLATGADGHLQEHHALRPVSSPKEETPKTSREVHEAMVATTQPHLDAMDAAAKAVAESQKPTEPAEETKTRRTRRSKAEIEADKLGEAAGFRKRRNGESAKDYALNLDDFQNPNKGRNENGDPTPNGKPTGTNEDAEQETSAPGGVGSSTDSPEELTQESLTALVLAAVEPKGTPEGDGRRKAIREHMATYKQASGDPVTRVGNLQTSDYPAFSAFVESLTA